MKIREQSIKEINELGPLDLLKVYELILSLKERVPVSQDMGISPPYLKARRALRGCRGSFADDVLAAREDRV
jgi:hypothetical protein